MPPKLTIRHLMVITADLKKSLGFARRGRYRGSIWRCWAAVAPRWATGDTGKNKHQIGFWPLSDMRKQLLFL